MSKHLYFTKDIDFGQQNVVYFYGKCITYFNRSHKGICFFRLTRKNSACCPQLADSRRRLQLWSRFYRGGGSGAPAKKYTKGAAPGRARLLWLEEKSSMPACRWPWRAARPVRQGFWQTRAWTAAWCMWPPAAWAWASFPGKCWWARRVGLSNILDRELCWGEPVEGPHR